MKYLIFLISLLAVEFDEIQQYIPGAKRFIPSNEMLEEILDGGVAIVDQWICAHSRYLLLFLNQFLKKNIVNHFKCSSFIFINLFSILRIL